MDQTPDACQPTMTDLSNWEKVQATTSSESAKCSFSSVHRAELTGTEANNSKDTPYGTTWADHQRAREREKRPKRTVQTHSIHTKKQTKTNATCKHTVPYVIGEISALSCPGNPKKVLSKLVSHNRVT